MNCFLARNLAGKILGFITTFVFNFDIKMHFGTTFTSFSRKYKNVLLLHNKKILTSQVLLNLS